MYREGKGIYNPYKSLDIGVIVYTEATVRQGETHNIMHYNSDT